MLGPHLPQGAEQDPGPGQATPAIVELIGKESWLVMSTDMKGDAYEGLLERNAQDTKAAPASTSRPRRSSRRSSTDAADPGRGHLDPACGTGGFLLAAHDYLTNPDHYKLDKEPKEAPPLRRPAGNRAGRRRRRASAR